VRALARCWLACAGYEDPGQLQLAKSRRHRRGSCP
jgi:hypothetical protein